MQTYTFFKAVLVQVIITSCLSFCSLSLIFWTNHHVASGTTEVRIFACFGDVLPLLSFPDFNFSVIINKLCK